MNVNVLTKAKRSYLIGLYLADGSLSKQRNRSFRLCYALQGNEGVIANRVITLLERSGLRPHLYRHKDRNDIMLYASSVNLNDFFPDKRVLLDHDHVNRRILGENKLLGVEDWVPFLAGLLDGDGHCLVSWRKKRGFRTIDQWRWGFTQRKYMFLVEYVKRFIESIAPRGMSIRVEHSGKARLSFNKSGINALLDAGIADHSWKATQWLKKRTEVKREQMSYFTVGQVARILNVRGRTVRKWIKAGRIAGCLRRTWFYVPVSEVGKLVEEMREERERIKRIKSEGIQFGVLVKLLGVSYATLRRWYPRGALKSTLVWEGSHRSLVVQREEAERITKELWEKSESVRRISNKGTKLVELAPMLGIPRSTLQWWYWLGKIQATLIREGRHRYLVIPTREVENLKRELKLRTSDIQTHFEIAR
jgi:excisionase family DNA binding protein